MEWKGERLGIVETRRHYTNYFKGIPNFKDIRSQLVTEDEPEVLFGLLNRAAETYRDLVM
jgi:hypothetical protein